LAILFNEIKKYEPKDKEGGKDNPYKSIFFYSIILNKSLESPFDISVKCNSPKSVEVYLAMLMEYPEQRLS
jgi:hypothetical protein